jgi:alcohol dehydrogenase class IV
MTKPPTISYLTDVWFEAGISSELPAILERFGVTRPLVVTDPGVVEVGIIGQLGVGSFPVFDDVETNPTETSVVAGADAYRGSGCDGVLAVGGGSPMDCAKCIALLITHPPPLDQYAFLNGGLTRITDKKPPVICVPTTAGTGSEVGRAALITMRGGDKLAVLSPKLIPNAAVCDPKLTLGLPPRLTAATGMDAISHCVETFCSPRINPVADAIALDGLGRAWRNILDATQNGSSLDARTEMMMAALEGGMTFQKGLGAIHSLSHPLGGLTTRRLHHGMLNAIFLPHVLRFNFDACPDKMDRMAKVIGVGAGQELPRAFEQLIADLGLPLKLRELGVSIDDLTPLAPAAVRDHSSATNPKPLTPEDCRRLIQAAY